MHSVENNTEYGKNSYRLNSIELEITNIEYNQ